ncbi:MAG: hypothetical protein GY835_18890 [bacterium]|nr:hypothetical protein [bacterium]
MNLLPGGMVLYLAMARVSADAVGSIENAATVSLPTAMSDYVPGNNAAAVMTPIGIFADGFESGDLSVWSSIVSGPPSEAREEPPADKFH